MLGITKEEFTKLLNEVKNQVFNLSIRMLSNVQLAEDATQDILLKIISQIDTLKDKNKFKPWALIIAKNHLLNVIKEDSRFQYISFEIMEKDCNIPMDEFILYDTPDFDKNKMLVELKISCSQAMLMCLSKEERCIYILSSMFGLNSVDGSGIMEITPDNFRQKLHRTKLKLKNFLENNCGLINKLATCKCNKRLDFAISNGRISKDRFTFTDENYLSSQMDIMSFIEMMEKYEDYSDVFMQNPQYAMPNEMTLPLLKEINKYFSN